jgi:hypothetical protein
MKKLNRFLITIFLLTLSNLSSAYVTVGATNDCDYASLEDAYNDADPFVRVTTEVIHNDVFTISKTKWYTGGYSTCALAESGTQSDNHTKWTNNGGNPIVDIDTGASNSIVVIDQFEIYNGDNSVSGLTGGIKARGNVSLAIANSLIHDNESKYGGGINLNGDDVRVTVTNSRIYNNSALDGGGVDCSNGASFTLLEQSTIKNNNSSRDGGGIFAISNCQVSIRSGDSEPPFQADLGIVGNTAQEQGGGIYISIGADVELMGNNQHPASIVGNVSNIDTNSVVIGGGGVYLRGDGNIPSDGTTFSGTNARIDFNIAKHAGAGIAVTNGATFTMNRSEEACWDNDKCSSLTQNILTDATGDGAAGYMYNVSSANISGTYIADNQANYSAAFALNLVGTLRLEGNLIVGNTSFTQPFASELFSLSGNNGLASNLDFYYNTLVDNNAGVSFNLDGASSQQWLQIYNSIIRDQGDIISANGAIDPFLNINCNYVHETDSLTAATTSVDNYNLNPGFVDSGTRDYHLAANSLAQDLCNENMIQSNYKDLNGNTRGVDNLDIGNLRGTFDAGAYEFTANDVIFSNSFD